MARGLVCTFFVGICFTACITPSEKRSMRDDIFNTQTRLLQVEQILQDASKDAKSTGDTANRGLASTQAELERLSRNMQQVKGDIDALKVAVVTGEMPGVDTDSQDKSLASLIRKIDERLEDVETTQAELVEALKKAGLKANAKKKDSDKPALTVDEIRTLFEKKKYKKLLDEAPRTMKDVAGDDKEHLKVLIAESMFKLGQVREAALKFNELIDAKASKKVMPLVKLRMGDSFRKLGDPATGKVYYEELLKEFPDSEEAEKAKGHLERMNPEKKEG